MNGKPKTKKAKCDKCGRTIDPSLPFAQYGGKRYCVLCVTQKEGPLNEEEERVLLLMLQRVFPLSRRW